MSPALGNYEENFTRKLTHRSCTVSFTTKLRDEFLKVPKLDASGKG